MLKDRYSFNQNALYLMAQDQELAPDKYPDAINLCTGTPGFLNPAYKTPNILVPFTDAAYQNLSTFSPEFTENMRDYCADKIGHDIPQDNFLIGVSTFNYFRYLVDVLPEYQSGNVKNQKGSTVVISPQGSYLLWNRIGGEMVKSDDDLSLMETQYDSGYKITAKDIEKWAQSRSENLQNRPTVLPLENPSIGGHVYSAEELIDIHASCKENGIFIFYDEVYRETCAPCVEFTSLPAVIDDMDNVLAVTTFSKGYGNLQLNLAGATGPSEVCELLYPHFKDEWRKTTTNHIKMVESIINDLNKEYLEHARTLYADKVEAVAQKVEELGKTLTAPLKIPHLPQAGYSMFIDATKAVTGQDSLDKKEGAALNKSLFEKFAQQGLVTQPLHASGIQDRLMVRLVFGNNDQKEINKGLDVMSSVIRAYEAGMT
ncbi:MAG: hypothetical protein CBB87_05005 [Micavibrio sp. TMED27]|nr:hypothetical protein [Micavibrio sp.]OUT91390.1 MAG: hypothetical protein CBB87_05005 [Micavibrio sp. TMED27]|tara:strand:- start:2183 stop:3469 length:1287 start_codon:yes stop_codon:yes gene_type:complete